MPSRLAFDSDVLIYAASQEHPHAPALRDALLSAPPFTHCGSVLLLPEVLSKPLRLGLGAELELLQAYLDRLELVEITTDLALLAAQLSAAYHLKAPDALHLACAVQSGADALVTNNRKDFKPEEILEIPVLYPEEIENPRPS